MSQQGYGLGGIFRSAGRYVSPILGEAGKIGVIAGADLVKNLLGDVIDGKSVKEAARKRGRQAGKQSLSLTGERAIQAIQAPKATPKATKRPRSQSAGTKKTKAKKSQKGGRKRKKSQKGGGRKRKKSQKGGKRKKVKGRIGRKKAVGVVFPRAMTSKQRRSLPVKDIFG